MFEKLVRYFARLVRQVEMLPRRMAHWHVYCTLARKNEKLARFWHAGTQAR